METLDFDAISDLQIFHDMSNNAVTLRAHAYKREQCDILLFLSNISLDFGIQFE